MRKILIAALAIVVIFYFFLSEVGEPIDETVMIATASQKGTGSGNGLVDPPRSFNPTVTGHLVEPYNSDPSTPLRKPATVAPDGETSAPSDGYVGPSSTTEGMVAVTDYPDEQTAALWRIAEHNMAQLYEVLWQTLEVEEPDDADFREFVLATLDELDNYTPGEILAALVQTAPTPALRHSALRLLAEASQELSLDPFNQALQDSDPAIRQFAQAFFNELSVTALLDAVTEAVLDRNRMVRLLAFSTMEEMHKFAPVWEVAGLVLDDPDAQIRMRALELLTYGDAQTAIDRLVLALGDPNPRVSELAAALLSEFEQSS